MNLPGDSPARSGMDRQTEGNRPHPRRFPRTRGCGPPAAVVEVARGHAPDWNPWTPIRRTAAGHEHASEERVIE